MLELTRSFGPVDAIAGQICFVITIPDQFDRTRGRYHGQTSRYRWRKTVLRRDLDFKGSLALRPNITTHADSPHGVAKGLAVFGVSVYMLRALSFGNLSGFFLALNAAVDAIARRRSVPGHSDALRNVGGSQRGGLLKGRPYGESHQIRPGRRSSLSPGHSDSNHHITSDPLRRGKGVLDRRLISGHTGNDFGVRNPVGETERSLLGGSYAQFDFAKFFDGQSVGGLSGKRETNENFRTAFDRGKVPDTHRNIERRRQRLADMAAAITDKS